MKLIMAMCVVLLILTTSCSKEPLTQHQIKDCEQELKKQFEEIEKPKYFQNCVLDCCAEYSREACYSECNVYSEDVQQCKDEVDQQHNNSNMTKEKHDCFSYCCELSGEKKQECEDFCSS